MMQEILCHTNNIKKKGRNERCEKNLWNGNGLSYCYGM